MKIALTGTPGVGKTSVAKKVSKILGLEHVNVSKRALEIGAAAGEDEGSILVDLDILKEDLEKMDNIVIDSHFAEAFDSDFIFVLRCEPKVLFERLKRRGYPDKKVKENVEAEILDYCLIHALENHPAEKIFEITENPAEEILSIVENPVKEKSVACGSRTQFLTEENLTLVE